MICERTVVKKYRIRCIAVNMTNKYNTLIEPEMKNLLSEIETGFTIDVNKLTLYSASIVTCQCNCRVKVYKQCRVEWRQFALHIPFYILYGSVQLINGKIK